MSDDIVVELIEPPVIEIEFVATGVPGVGVPPGGTTAQVLAKASNDDYDDEWVDATSGTGIVQSVVAGTNVTVDDTDPANPIVSSTGGGGGGAVDSVNGETGVVVLTTDDIADTAANRFTDDTAIARLANTSGTNTGDQNLSGYVPTTRTVNGHALSSNVTVSKSDVGLGNADDTSDATKNAAAVNLTNKTITSPIINTSVSGTAIDTDGTLAANSDTLLSSQKAIKTYAQKRIPSGTSRYQGGTVHDYCLPGQSLLDAATTSTPSTNRWTFEPYIVTEPTTFDRVAMEITTAGAAGKLARLAIYTADEFWQPDTLVQDFGTIATDVGAVPTVVTITINLTLQPGRYLGIFIIDGAVTFRAISAYLPGVGLSAAGTTTPFRSQFLSLSGSGTVASGFAAVSPSWERDVFFTNSGKFLHFMRWREAV